MIAGIDRPILALSALRKQCTCAPIGSVREFGFWEVIAI